MTAEGDVSRAAGWCEAGGARDRATRWREWLQHPVAIFAVRCGVVLAMLAGWQLASRSADAGLWISSPPKVLQILLRWSADGSLWLHLKTTLTAMLAGYAIGAATGTAAGIGLGLSPFVERLLSPFIVALYSLPKIAIAPLLVITFGIGIESKIVLVAITVFFMMLFSAMDGVRDLDQDLVRALRTMGASTGEVIRKVLLPGAVSWIFAGLKVAVRFAFTAAILGEIISSNRGLGYLIEFSAAKYDFGGVVAAIVVVVVISVAMTEALGVLERSTGRWQATKLSDHAPARPPV